MNWSGKKVLVTGAAGFIGSHLTERLVELGADVRAFVHYNALDRRGWLDGLAAAKSVDIHAGDITDADSVTSAMAGVDTVFHLAALIAIPYSYRAPESYIRTNVLGTLNVLRAAQRAGVRRMVHTSTSEVYGSARQVPITEEHPLQAQSPYAASKIGADKVVEAMVCSNALPVVTVRPFNTYGPRQSARAVVPTIITQCLSGTPAVRLGNVEPTRDFVFVADTAAGMIAAAEARGVEGQTVQLGTGQETTIGDLAALIVSLCGSSATVEQEAVRTRPSGSEVARLVADSSRAADLLGWKAAMSLGDGLRATIAWFRENQQRYRPDEFTL